MAEAKLFGEACSSTEFSQFVSTQQTAYDMEFLRQYLGKSKPNYAKLNYIGYSYGTWLGTWYADTYPNRVGRFILDSNMNWTTSMYANQLSDSFSFQRRRDQMFFPWLARHNKTYRLGNTTAKVPQQLRADPGQPAQGLPAGRVRALAGRDGLRHPDPAVRQLAVPGGRRTPWPTSR